MFHLETLCGNLEAEAADIINADTCPKWAQSARASVSIVLVGDRILFIERAQRAGDRWSGQMAFPGGRRHDQDASDMHTAERETLEECGLDLAKDAILLGQLNDRPVYHWFSSQVMMIISAFGMSMAEMSYLGDVLFRLMKYDLAVVYKWKETAGYPAFLLDRREVAAVYLVPIAHLLDFMHQPEKLRRNKISYPIFTRVRWLSDIWKMIFSWCLGDIHFPSMPIPNQHRVAGVSNNNNSSIGSNQLLWGLTLGICSDFMDLVLSREQSPAFVSLNTVGVWFDAWDVNGVLRLLDRRRNSVGRRSDARYNWGTGAAAVIISAMGARALLLHQTVRFVRSRL